MNTERFRVFWLRKEMRNEDDYLQAIQATLILQASCSPISIHPDPFRPVNRRQSYEAPSAPPSYQAPTSSSSSSSSSCVVERSTVDSGDCQQGGQECHNECSSTPRQDCSSPAQPVCVTVTEQKCEIQYEVSKEESCSV